MKYLRDIGHREIKELDGDFTDVEWKNQDSASDALCSYFCSLMNLYRICPMFFLWSPDFMILCLPSEHILSPSLASSLTLGSLPQLPYL